MEGTAYEKNYYVSIDTYLTVIMRDFDCLQ